MRITDTGTGTGTETLNFQRAGQLRALEELGLATTSKHAGVVDWAARAATKGRNFGVNPKSTGWLSTLIGEPERLLHPIDLIKEWASFKPTRAAWNQMTKGDGLWERTKGLGNLGQDMMGKTFGLGLPAYGVARGLTATPEPGRTKGEAVGHALGEGLGWLPPMGVLGMTASFVAPHFSVPGLLGRVGGLAGRGASALIGEEPQRTPMPQMGYENLYPEVPQSEQQMLAPPELASQTERYGQ